MIVLLLQVVLAQGPGSTLEVQSPNAAPPSTITTSQPQSIIQTRKAEGFTPSSLELRNSNALVRRVTLVEGRRSPCELMAQMWLCDDPEVVSGNLINEPLFVSDGGTPIVPHMSFLARKAGVTTCWCGSTRESAQLVYEFTVGSLEDAVRPVARKVVGEAFSRLYTQRRSLVP